MMRRNRKPSTARKAAKFVKSFLIYSNPLAWPVIGGMFLGILGLNAAKAVQVFDEEVTREGKQ